MTAPGGTPLIIELTTGRSLGQRLLIFRRFLQRLVDAEARRLLSWRKFFERREKFRNYCLSWDKQKRPIGFPLRIENIRVLGGPFKRVRPQVVEIRDPFCHERLFPHLESLGALLHESTLPVTNA